jgi:hypothetical protein
MSPGCGWSPALGDSELRKTGWAGGFGGSSFVVVEDVVDGGAVEDVVDGGRDELPLVADTVAIAMITAPIIPLSSPCFSMNSRNYLFPHVDLPDSEPWDDTRCTAERQAQQLRMA